jgi:hypothetical protein
VLLLQADDACAVITDGRNTNSCDLHDEHAWVPLPAGPGQQQELQRRARQAGRQIQGRPDLR